MRTVTQSKSAPRGGPSGAVESLQASDSHLMGAVAAPALIASLSHKLDCITSDVNRGLVYRALGLGLAPDSKTLDKLLEGFQSQGATLRAAAKCPELERAASQAEEKLLVALGAAVVRTGALEKALVDLDGGEARLLRVAVSSALKSEKPLSEEERKKGGSILEILAESEKGKEIIGSAGPTGPKGPVIPQGPNVGVVTGGASSTASRDPEEISGGGAGNTIPPVGTEGGDPDRGPRRRMQLWGFPTLGKIFGAFTGLGPIERHKLLAMGATVVSGVGAGFFMKTVVAVGAATLFPSMAAAGAFVGLGLGIWCGCLFASKVNGFALKWMMRKIDADLTAPLRNAPREEERPQPILARLKKSRDLLARQMGLEYVMERVDAVVYTKQRMDAGSEPARELHDVLDGKKKLSPEEDKKARASLWRQLQMNVERIEKGDSAKGIPSTREAEGKARKYKKDLQARMKTFLEEMAAGGEGTKGYQLRDDLERSGINGFSFSTPGRVKEWIDFAARHSQPGIQQVAQDLREYIKELPAAKKKEWNELLILDREYASAWNNQVNGLCARQQVEMLSLFELMQEQKKEFIPINPQTNAPYQGIFEEVKDPTTGKTIRKAVSFSLRDVLYAAKVEGLSIRSSGGMGAWLEAVRNNPNQRIVLGQFFDSQTPGKGQLVEVAVNAKTIAAALEEWVAHTPVKEGKPPISERWERLLVLDADYAEALNQYKARDLIFDELMVRLRGPREEEKGAIVDQFLPQMKLSIFGFAQPVYEAYHAFATRFWNGRRYSSQWRPDMRDTPDFDLAQTLVAYSQVHKFTADLCDIWANEDQLTKNSVKSQIESQIKRIDGLQLPNEVAHDGSIVNQVIYRYHPLSLFPRHFFNHTVLSDNPKVKVVLPFYAMGGGFAHAAGLLPGLFSAVGSVAVTAASYAWSSGASLVAKADKEANNKKA